MVKEGYKRKISAILSADVVGYSRLMGDDESATVRTLGVYRDTIFTAIEEHRGRTVDSPGDNILSEFASVVDAVQCAVEIQQVIKARNAELPEDRRMTFRIGINLGDVIEEGESIYGDGVNIAARIEALAEPGGICISGSAYEQIASKLALGYVDTGDHSLKNISRPIRVYRIPLEFEGADGDQEGDRGGILHMLGLGRRVTASDSLPADLADQSSKEVEGYYIGGFVCLAVALGFALLGYLIARGDPETFYAIAGIGGLVGLIGVALIGCAKWLERRHKRSQ